MTFESFDLRQDEGLSDVDLRRLTKAVQDAHQFAEKPRGWLVIIGEPGTGKTHLAGAIANECKGRAESQSRVMFVTSSELLDYLRATFYPSSSVGYDKRLDEIKRADVLILDNLILEAKNTSLSSWARDKLFEVLMYRFDYDLPTIITTYQKLNEMDVRFKSRATNEAHSTVIALTVPSYPGKVNRKVAAPPRKMR
jgi:DNA replication protein DnaC